VDQTRISSEEVKGWVGRACPYPVDRVPVEEDRPQALHAPRPEVGRLQIHPLFTVQYAKLKLFQDDVIKCFSVQLFLLTAHS
jgi:hypothetical protein